MPAPAKVCKKPVRVRLFNGFEGSMGRIRFTAGLSEVLDNTPGTSDHREIRRVMALSGGEIVPVGKGKKAAQKPPEPPKEPVEAQEPKWLEDPPGAPEEDAATTAKKATDQKGKKSNDTGKD